MERRWSSVGTALLGWGMDAESGRVFAICAATHLTDFAVSSGIQLVPKMNSIDPSKDLALLSQYDATNFSALALVATLVVVHILIFISASRLDRLDRRRCDT